MKFLLFDTATERGIVAIFQGRNLLFHHQLPMGYQSSQNLLSVLEQGLAETGLRCRDMSFIAIGIGPGSYTGMRIGAAAAKSLSFACSLPIVAFSSLQGFVPEEEGSFASVIDAKIGGVYLQKGEKKEGKVTFFDHPSVIPLVSAKMALKNVERLVTPNSMNLRPKLEAEIPGLDVEWKEQWPNFQYLGEVACERYQAKEYVVDQRFELLYLRKTQAEIEKEG